MADSGHPSDDDDAAVARTYVAEALRSLAEIADKPGVEHEVREDARKELEKWL
jgi:hypothetical protein